MLTDDRRELAERLRARFTEIEYAVITGIGAVAPVDGKAGTEYASSMRKAIRAAICYCVDGIESGIEHGPQIPTDLIGQARIASRHGVEFGTIVRRYNVGSSRIRAFVVEQAHRDRRFQGAALGRLLEELDTTLERLLIEFEHEYSREPRNRHLSSNAHLLRRIERRLAREPVDLSDQNYDFDGHHIGAVTEGETGAKALRSLAKAIDARLLLVPAEDNVTWAWIGTRRPVDRKHFERLLTFSWAEGIPLGLGEPGSGSSDWCLTHEQAKDAFSLCGPDTHTHYAQVALVAAVERDPIASAYLRGLLEPLQHEGDRGAALRHTLRVYLASGWNGKSSAAALAVSRQTVAERLKRIEHLLGRPLRACSADLETAITLERFS